MPEPATEAREPSIDSLRRAAFAGRPNAVIIIFDTEFRLVLAEGQDESRHPYESNHLLGRALSEVASPATFDRLHPHYQAALDGKPSSLDHHTLDGTLYRIELEPLHDDHDRIIGAIAISEDVTESRQIELRLLEATMRFETAFNAAPIGMALVAPDGRFLRVNESFCKLTGYSGDELTDLGFAEITHPDDLEADLAYVRELLEGRIDAYDMEKRYITKSGDSVWIRLSVSLVRNDAGEPLHFISQVQDISERKALEERLRWLADHDSLTGVRNRRLFEEDLAVQISRCQRYEETAALVILDLDDLKEVNDRLGHVAGDALLKAVVAAIRVRLRSGDHLSRLGGDEFAVLLAHVNSEHANSIAADFKRSVADAALEIDGQSLSASVSFGVAMIDGRSTSGDEVMAVADEAMYAQKREARRRG